MDFQHLINIANREGSKFYGGLNSIYNQADRALGGNLPFGVAPTPAPTPTPTRRKRRGGGGKFNAGPVINYLKEVPDKGLIPIPTFNPTNEALDRDWETCRHLLYVYVL